MAWNHRRIDPEIWIFNDFQAKSRITLLKVYCQYEDPNTKNANSFDCNPHISSIEDADMVCATTFITKILRKNKIGLF